MRKITKGVNMEESIAKESLKTDKVAVTVYISPEERVNVEKRRAIKPNYLMIGNGTMNKNRIFGIDLLKELANSTKAEQFLLLAIKDGITYENEYNPIVKIVAETETHKKYLKIGYKSLLERGLVVRIKQSHYMINPNALIPLDYEEALKIWEEAVRKNES